MWLKYDIKHTNNYMFYYIYLQFWALRQHSAVKQHIWGSRSWNGSTFRSLFASWPTSTTIRPRGSLSASMSKNTSGFLEGPEDKRRATATPGALYLIRFLSCIMAAPLQRPWQPLLFTCDVMRPSSERGKRRHQAVGSSITIKFFYLDVKITPKFKCMVEY